MGTNIETVKQTKHKLKGERMETNMTTVEQTEILKEEITNIYEQFISESNNPLYLKEFLSVNSSLLKKSFSDDYEKLALEYSYRSISEKYDFIEDVVDEFFIVQKIDMDQLRKIKRSIERIFLDYMELFFSQIKTEILSLKFQSRDNKEHLIKGYEYVWSSIGGYREYLETKDVDRHTKLLLTYKYLPPNIQREIDDHELDKGIRLKGVIEVLISRIKNPGYKEKALDIDLKNVVTMHTKEILEMNDQCLSLNKIQKLLTEHCIKEGTISSTMQRVSRKKGSKDEMITVPTLLSLSKIKEIIENREKPCLIAN